MKKLLIPTILMLLIAACGSQQTVEIADTPVIKEPTIEVPTAIPATVAPIATPKPATATSVPLPKLTLDDIHIELVVLEKQCFGSAGCTITVKPELAIDDPVQILPDEEYTLIYEIYGGEDGTLTFNLTIEGDYYYSRESRVSTAHKNDELTVRAVRLLEN